MILQNDTQAVTLLLQGGVGVLPTDTLYGLVARAADPKAVARMYALKERDHKPGTVIAADIQQLVDLGVERHLLDRVGKLWPASLSIETPLGPQLSYLHQRTGRQGLRVVPDPRVMNILKKTGPLVTSSANLAGKEPAGTIDEAYEYFGDAVDFYVDGGDRSGGLPSTIARITDNGIEIIRQGAVMIPEEMLTHSVAVERDCPFCLDNDLLKTPLLYEDDIAYVTPAPDARDAFLIIPKSHTEHAEDLPSSWWQSLKTALQHIPAVLTHYNISLNYGELAGQNIRHLHFWVIPRTDGKKSSNKGLAALIATVDS